MTVTACLPPLRVIWLLAICMIGCRSYSRSVVPTVSFTKLPPYAEGGSSNVRQIEGRAEGARPGQRVVVYAKSGIWWVQPFAGHELTQVGSDFTWQTQTHPGWAYAALLVTEKFHPRSRMEMLPLQGGAVVALAIVEPPSISVSAGKTISFAGYEWEVRQTPNNPGNTQTDYDVANAFTSADGFLHLRIRGTPDNWSCAEVNLPRGLGYGTYRFVLRDVSQFEPAAVFSIDFHHEMDIEISRWGDREAENGQFVIQPYNIPANTAGFRVPPGIVSFMLRWQPGRTKFTAFRGTSDRKSDLIEEHEFTSGVPTPGDDPVHLNFYVFGNNNNPLRHGTEVIIEKFEFLP
jgi:hypothetical protein